jgi:hypothetical protein
MRFLVRTVTLLALSVGMAAPAFAATSHVITATPSSGPAGSSFSLHWAGFTQCRIIAFTWAGAALTTGSPGTAGTTTATVPSDAKAGTHPIGARCGDETATAVFTVTVTTTTATTPPPTTTPPPATTTTPHRITTTPPRTTAPTTTTTTTTTPPPPTTTPAPTTTSAPPETTPSTLRLDHGTIQPGDRLTASGTGCQPGHDVTLTSDGQRVGHAHADADGKFTAPVEFTTIQPGRHTITADCGVVLTGVVDQAVTSSDHDYPTTVVLLVFFVLAAIVFVRFH